MAKIITKYFLFINKLGESVQFIFLLDKSNILRIKCYICIVRKRIGQNTNKVYKIINVLVLCMIMCSCAHRHSKESDDYEETVSSPVTLTLNIISKPNFYALKRNLPQTTNNDKYFRKRFLIEVCQDNTVITRQTISPDSLSLANDSLFLSTKLELQTLQYDLSIWMDYTKDNSDLHYITENLNKVTCVEPYCGNTASKECLYGHKTIDLRKYRKQENIHAETNITIRPPVAKYEIIATDVEEFIKQTSWPFNKKYRITFTYLFFYPMVFNAHEGVIKDSWSNVSFDLPLNITDNKQKECKLGFDYILADTTINTAMLVLTVKDENNKEIITSPPISIPYKQGYSTRIAGNFLTKSNPGGIEINTEFDDEINIDIDDLLTY